MSYPSWRVYEALYHKWLWSRDPAQLFRVAVGEAANPERLLDGAHVMDIGAGTARLSREAFDHGAAHVYVIEPERQMIRPSNIGLPDNMSFGYEYANDKVHIYTAEACVALGLAHARPVDFAFSQQAVNNWLDRGTAKDLARWVKKKGVFVFSTFNNKPDRKPHVKEYWEAGRNYVEVTFLRDYLDREWVEHVQICEGYEPHVSRFPWIAPDEYDNILCEWFNVRRIREGNADIYRCERV